ncbi:oxidoreductase [Mycena epipterygia]|nr:oxidoreductase [Mycena epipterygia]
MPPQKVALVTGCSEGGIGSNLCLKLAERNFMVYATSRSTSTMETLEHLNIKKLALDVRDDSAVKSVVATIIEEAGQIDLLINNAGIFTPGPVLDATAEVVKDVFDTNVVSIIRLCGAVVPHMAKRKSGTIINMSSILAQFPVPWTAIYGSSKAAIHTLTEVLSMECKPFNVHVVLASAGAVRSKIIDKQDNFALAPNSLYGDFFKGIRIMIDMIRDNEMPTDVFTEGIVSKVLRTKPPRFISTGGNVTFFRLLGYLPRSIYLAVVWWMFSRRG